MSDLAELLAGSEEVRSVANILKFNRSAFGAEFLIGLEHARSKCHGVRRIPGARSYGSLVTQNSEPGRYSVFIPAAKTLVFFVAFYAFFLWLLPFRLLHEAPEQEQGPVLWTIGILLVILGIVMTASCGVELVIRGRGTPAVFDPPRRLVSGAFYSRMRNPMYFGWILVLIGEAAFLRSWKLAMASGVFWLIAHAFVILYEEPFLRKTFGPSYDTYTAAVPRWLPRIRTS